MNPPVLCGGGLEGDVVAEGLELGDGALPGAVAVTSDKEVAAELGIVAVAVQQVPGDHQDRVAHGDGGLLLKGESRVLGGGRLEGDVVAEG